MKFLDHQHVRQYAPVGQQLDDLLNNSELFEKVSEGLEEPEKSILEAALDPSSARIDLGAEERFFYELTNSHPGLFIDVSGSTFFQKFNEAKSYLRETRKLADRTVKDVRGLKIVLGGLDETNDPLFLKIFINRMKDLMLETLESLKEAKEKYNTAVETFVNVKYSIKTIGRRTGTGMWESGENFDKTIKVAIDILSDEINLIAGWILRAKVVSKNIDEYPEEFLKEFKSLRNIFIIGLDDLKKAAETFATQPPVRQYALDIYRRYLDQQNALRMNVGENLLEAERNILAVSALKHAVEAQYFPAYDEAKSLVRKTRQELRELADSTWTKVRDLKIVLENLDECNNSLFFKIFINRMKVMRIDPVEMLKESRATYESAVKTFENTNSFIATKIGQLERASVSSRVTEIGQSFDKTLKLLIDILDEEIEMISIWTKSAKTVSKNIENISEDDLRQFQSVKTIFMNGLDDLKNATDTFLAQPQERIKLN